MLGMRAVSRHVASTVAVEPEPQPAADRGAKKTPSKSSLAGGFPDNLGPLRLLPVTLASAGKGLKVEIDAEDSECARHAQTLTSRKKPCLCVEGSKPRWI